MSEQTTLPLFVRSTASGAVEPFVSLYNRSKASLSERDLAQTHPSLSLCSSPLLLLSLLTLLCASAHVHTLLEVQYLRRAVTESVSNTLNL